MMKNRLKLHKNKGFTLVELIVVLVLLTILISLGISGLLSWQDYSKFKQENTNAETIFYAVQNQFTEYGASGVFDEKVTDVMKTLDGHKIGDPDNQNYFNGSKISYGEGSTDYYKWQPDGSTNGIAIWANTPTGGNITNDEKKNYQGSIYFMAAEKGDYDKYISGSLGSDKADTKLLFDIITPYISEKSVLNGAILVEFSPEARQVFSVCYSDKAKSFTYASGSGSIISVLVRDEATRHDLMMGYYATESMSVPIVGRSKGKAIQAKLINGNVLELVITPENPSGSAEYVVRFYKASSSGGVMKDNPLGYFSFKASSIKDSLDAAAKAPADVVFTKDLEMENVRIPIWKSGNEIHIVLDAADAQAQSYMYEDFMNGQASGEDFINTFSFYRFGFTTDDLTEMACGVKEKNGSAEGISNIESTVFASVSKEAGTKTYVIKNARHLYNVRFETDYKEDDENRIFKLAADIDWQVFVGNKTNDTSDGTNYYLTSYNTNDATKKSGINYDGYDYSINRPKDEEGNAVAITNLNKLDTSNYAFPGFRSLGVNDVFTGKKDDSEDTYTISGLTITYSANMAYGVYGYSALNIWNTSSISDFGKYPSENPTTGSELHTAHKNANKGLYPLGLFAENSGTIEYLALNAHKVIGMELLKDYENSNKLTLVYTNMVGGFAGDNLGRLNHLKLRDVDDLAKEDLRKNEAGVTFVNGKTDVGGVFGRVSWTAYGANDLKEENNPLAYLENYGKVTGMENVGGIVGRAYVLRDYAGNTTEEKYLDHYVERHSYYVDGYDIFGKYSDDGKYQNGSSKGIRNQVVNRLDYITIKDCKNRGEVSGDALIHAGKTVYLYEDILRTKWQNEDSNRHYVLEANKNLSNECQRCAFIGGIAGITMDGYYYDFNAGQTNWIGQDSTFAENYNNNMRVKVQNCNSYRLYYGNDAVSDAELNVLKSSQYNSFDASSDIYDKLIHDFYVGGLVGYARLTEFNNCGNAVDANDTVKSGDSGYYKAFVFGRSYAGGLFGCFDLSKISSDELIEGRYNAVNNTNVIGVMYSGGFAGGLGIGEASQQHLSYKHPSTNLGSVASQIAGYMSGWRLSGIKNTAVVLGAKREALGYDGNSLIKLQDTKAFTEKGFQSYYVNLTFSNYDAGIGGIAGCTRMEVENCDNIQTSDTKNYALMLLGFVSDEKDYDSFVYSDYKGLGNTLYGGNGVGGIFGYAQAYNGNNITILNANNDAYSKVDAVVYGEDVVGGILGGSIMENIPTINRGYLDNALVMGRNMVGGYVGKDACRINMKDTYTMGAFRVYGELAVGGFSGLSYSNDSTVYINGGKVEGLAYVGGVTGLYCTEQKITGRVEGISVKSEFFAGGFAGAIYNENKDYKNIRFSNINVISNNVSVQAGSGSDNQNRGAFAGGFAGLYSYRYTTTNYNDYFRYDVVYNNTHGLSINKSPNRDSALILIINSFRASSDYYLYVLDYYECDDTYNGVLNTCIPQDKKLTYSELTFNNNVLPRTQASVSAGMFAGGVFGYIPNNLEITIDLNTMKSPITTPVTTFNAVQHWTLSNEDYMPENEAIGQTYASDRVLSYAGGIIGRNPNKLTIKNAAYSGVIKNYDGAYCLGQLTEINAGTIKSSKVMPFADGSSKRNIMGGLVGANFGTIEKDNEFADDLSLSGKSNLGGFIGENYSDMSLDGWEIDASTVTLSVSDADDSAAGFIAGINSGKIDVTDSAISGGTVSGAEYAGVYFGKNYNEISDSRVYTYLHDETSYRTSVMYNDIYDATKKLSISPTMTVSDCNKVGMICGWNNGAVKDVIISEYSSIGGNCDYFGAISGEVLNDGDGGIVSHCMSFMNIGDDNYKINNAGGIVGKIDFYSGDSVINLCDNYGAVKGKVSAAGIVAEITKNGDTIPSIDDCINLGAISSEGSSAGIAAITNGTGNFTRCRNYGVSTSGIVAGTPNSVTKCLVANGTDSIPTGSMNYYIKGTSQDVAGSNEFPTDNVAWPLHLSIYKDSDNTKWLTYEDGSGSGNIATDMSWWDGFDDPYDVSVTGIDRMYCFDVYFLSKWQ